MNTRFDLMNKLKDTLREKLKKTIQSEEAYKILMKKLVIQVKKYLNLQILNILFRV